MSNVVELSKAGSLVVSAVVLEVADTPRLHLRAQWVLVRSAVVRPEDQAASEEAVSGAASTVEEDVEAFEVDSKIGEATVVVVEEVLATKAVEVSKEVVEEVMEAAIAVGMVGPMDMLPQMPQQVQEVVVVEALEAAVVEEGAMALALQNETDLRLAVGMIRAVAVAHMMTETPDTAAATEAMGIAMEVVQEVAATWSR
jgi:hypothetical protein